MTLLRKKLEKIPHWIALKNTDYPGITTPESEIPLQWKPEATEERNYDTKRWKEISHSCMSRINRMVTLGCWDVKDEKTPHIHCISRINRMVGYTLLRCKSVCHRSLATKFGLETLLKMEGKNDSTKFSSDCYLCTVTCASHQQVTVKKNKTLKSQWWFLLKVIYRLKAIPHQNSNDISYS